MPCACLLFDEHLDASMRTTARAIAEGAAAFEPQPIFHMPVIGSLHQCAAHDVEAACSRMARDGPLSFRFVKWEISGGHMLRAVIDAPTVDALATRLKQELGHGRPWRSHYATIGSVAAMDPMCHQEFLEAVATAFPIDQRLVYQFKARVEFNMHNGPTQNAPKPKSSHQKWMRAERPAAMMITKETTGITGQSKSGGIAKRALAKQHKKRGKPRSNKQLDTLGPYCY